MKSAEWHSEALFTLYSAPRLLIAGIDVEHSLVLSLALLDLPGGRVGLRQCQAKILLVRDDPYRFLQFDTNADTSRR